MIRQREMVKGYEHDLTSMLPIDAWQKGMRLILRQARVDPVYLLDSQGVIIQEWEYVPRMGEVDDACRAAI